MTKECASRRLVWALEGSLHETGCPVCRALRDDENGYWHFFVYGGFQEPGVAGAVARSLR